ncbi:hypothetical protein, partial [Clostridioides difficile]|uniref:hypothetical protein n=1 Tax=Clostridioides difficile TaxID=1496 RepID=UPI001A9A39C3
HVVVSYTHDLSTTTIYILFSVSIQLFFSFFLTIRRAPRSTPSSSSAASVVYKRKIESLIEYELIQVVATMKPLITYKG